MISPKLAVRHHALAGSGMFATEPIEVGELVWELNAGASIVTLAEYWALSWKEKKAYDQIGPDAFAEGTAEEYFWNHSCEPNCFSEDLAMYAWRRIEAGEELTYDYGLAYPSIPFKIDCTCGSTRCRGVVTHEDYLLPEVQAQHAGHIPPWIADAIRSQTEPVDE